MRRWSLHALRFLLVTLGVVVVTSLSIDATDSLRGSQSALSIMLREVAEGDCPDDMVVVERSDRTRFCLDRFEVSAGEGCLFQDPALSDETARNSNLPECLPKSVPGRLPWTNVTQLQAGELCARAEKRLPTSEEWYKAVRGTPDSVEACALDRDLQVSGQMSKCRSGVGAQDMIGNVWEWVDGAAVSGVVSDVVLPKSGFVTEVDRDSGIPTNSSSSPSEVFNHDFVWSRSEGQSGIMRGGFHRSRDDAGIYSLHAAVDTQFAGPAIGFRCALSL